MKKTLILMSTFNGGKRIIRQINSIINQIGVEVHILIRDDGSSDYTKKILERVANEYSGRINIIYGNNKGWKQSFIDLIYDASLEFDYYGFSDQDDIWMEDKIVSCITLMENDKSEGVKLAHCNALSVDSNLVMREEQEFRKPSPKSFKTAISTEYFQGCGMVWNKDAMILIQRYRPKNVQLAHDYWVGLLCYTFGKVYFREEAKFFHIRYGNNESSDGSCSLGRRKRIELIKRGSSAYMNPAQDLVIGYFDLLPKTKGIFVKRLTEYKKSLKDKLYLVFDISFSRPTIGSTVLFKYQILTNKY